MRIERGLLRSRVARRVFLIFVVSALLPVLAFASYSMLRVSDQLRDQADRQLHRSVKATGMTLVERLDLASQDLRIAGEILDDAAEGSSSLPEEYAALLDDGLSSRLAARFLDVKLIGSREDEHIVIGDAFAGPRLSVSDRALLDEGYPLVRTLPESDGASRVALILPLGASGNRMVGRLSPSYLWPAEGSATLETVRICVDPQGELLFASGLEGGAIPDLASLLDMDENSGRFSWRMGDESWLGRHWYLFMEYQYQQQWIIVETAPEAAVLAPVREFRLVFGLTCALSFAFVLFFSSVQIRKQLVPIEKLQEATRRIALEQFGERVHIETGDEFEELAESFNTMASDLEKNMRMRRALIDLGIELTAEGNEKNLLQILIRGVRRVLNCDGSGVVVLDEKGEPDSFVSELLGEIRTLNHEQILAHLPADRMEEHDAVEAAFGRPLHSVLALPLKDYDGERIGTLYAIDSRSIESGDLVGFPLEVAQLGNLLAAQASAALTQSRLLEGFKHLFDGLSQLIATAIDEKSPYTYGHCQRVPIATMILTDAVCRAEEGPYADFSLTQDERYEMQVAALLHDCGKVTTPVHVVDKATKLETIFDRIHLVRSRFEVVARDRRIQRLQEQLRAATNGTSPANPCPSGDDPATDARWEAGLEADLEFLVRCNTGGEFLAKEAQERIRDIGTRYEFTDRDGNVHPLLTDEEIENLSISRGTLTGAERKIIQDHVVSTIRMLSMLPYPKNLARVPLIAGAHHEWMNGKGYPNGIHIGELPLQARILALADVFEALTAKDRPYKDGKTLSEALRIMGFMKKDGHLDPELFDFFLTEGVYMEYAQHHLEPYQIDEVDISSIPGCEGLVPARRAA